MGFDRLLFADFQPLALIATTPTGAQRLQPLNQLPATTLWVSESLSQIEGVQTYSGSLSEHLANIWPDCKSLVFCLATGAVIRLIAPLLQDKSCDPAVVVVDEAGKFVISLCSGHQGKADRLAQLVARQIGATPVITGASASLGLPGIDVLGVPFGWNRGTGDWTKVSAAIARGELVRVIQEAGSTLWQSHLPETHPFDFGVPEEAIAPQARVWISHQQVKSRRGAKHCARTKVKSQDSTIPEVRWHPRVLWVGMGCERGTSRKLIAAAIQQVCQANDLAEDAIAGIATIDIKADEAGILELCGERCWHLRTFPAEILRTVEVPNPSTVVEAEVGTPSVAEAAAICAAGDVSQIQPSLPTPLPWERGAAGGVRAEECWQADLGLDRSPTLKPVQGRLLVSKQIFCFDTEDRLIQNPKSKIQNRQGAVTVAIAQSQLEYTGRKGSLWLVGTGPGKLEQMTPAAQTAITAADAVIGYSLYIDLISPLLRPGQIVEALPITQERQRAERAIALAKWGLTVAVVSSGDCGIYGMAGLVLEELQRSGWDGKTPSVEVFPGITALQAAAARVGAPLMHDFCAISLSDLLTPWEVIEKRLIAAAQADFVTALYNPRSQTRTQQIVTVQQIFLQYRHPSTPVAIVRSAYRSDEEIAISTLEKFLDLPIDMLTTVIIGNQSSRTHADWIITPRGYNSWSSFTDCD
ncbi:MAG: precorrin-3B C(17)-methyltransferase [Cyanosarcina radialis HA8281-LM2]|jgi:cobalt-precorrin 5A hydrolase/precorrin-3B C17-methyltransferase|nr:precorrin-3B C(17)-methyltransferase [Cyanosarcina radialis HA8281-LM2]